MIVLHQKSGFIEFRTKYCSHNSEEIMNISKEFNIFAQHTLNSSEKKCREFFNNLNRSIELWGF